MNSRPIRVPTISRKQASDLDSIDEIEAILGGSDIERTRQQAEFIREELARIGNQIDRAKIKGL